MAWTTPYVSVFCDICGSEEVLELTPLARGGWDTRGAESELERGGWQVTSDSVVCPDCLEEEEEEEEEEEGEG